MAHDLGEDKQSGDHGNRFGRVFSQILCIVSWTFLVSTHSEEEAFMFGVVFWFGLAGFVETSPRANQWLRKNLPTMRSTLVALVGSSIFLVAIGLLFPDGHIQRAALALGAPLAIFAALAAWNWWCERDEI